MSALVLAPGEKNPFKVSDAVNQAVQGRDNASGSLTLAANATTTTVAALTCAAGSNVILSPATANAAAAVATTYVPTSTVTKSQFIVNHASATTTDRTFFYTVRG